MDGQEDRTVEFRGGCLPGAEPGRHSCEAVVIKAWDVKRLTFAIEVAGPESVPRALGAGASTGRWTWTRSCRRKGQRGGRSVRWARVCEGA